MLSPEMVLILGLVSVYMILGPFILLFIYIYLDRLSKNKEKTPFDRTPDKKDPALWTPDDVMLYLKYRSR